MVDADFIQRNIHTHILGESVLVYEQVESTNDLLKSVWDNTEYNGLVVFARYQTNGRGRNGSKWFAGYDTSVLCSTLVFLEGSRTELYGPITLSAALATAQAIENTFNISPSIKWPNDIHINRKKLAGILVESNIIDGKVGFIIGVGINCRMSKSDLPDDIQDIATSISIELNRTISAEEMNILSAELVNQLDYYLDLVNKREFDFLKNNWLSRIDPINVDVTKKDRNFSGRIIDIDPKQNILIVKDNITGLIITLSPQNDKINIL